MSIAFTLNERRIEADGFDPNLTLLQFLRERGLTGAKEGCAEGECGACAVVMVKRDEHGKTHFEPVNSCLVLLASVADQELFSVEGLAKNGELHPVQRAMVDLGGSQCGYCTPGFVMSLFAEYYRPGRDGYDPEAISGNLCRCTGYRPIRDVAMGLGPARDDDFKRRLGERAPELSRVEHARDGRRFFRPTSLADALALKARNPEARFVAGGTDVVVEVNQRHERFDCLISLEGVPELRHWRETASELEIGAGMPLSEVERRAHGRVPMLEQLLPLFSSRLIRNRATFGGNIMTASPIGDGPPALLALDAELTLAGPGGTRRIALSDFFLGYRKTRATPEEILVSVHVPLPLPERQRFYKVSKRVIDDISTVAAAYSLRLDGNGVVTRARLAYGGVAATPARALEAERVLTGKKWSLEAVHGAQAVLAATFQPITDHRGSADYRQSMVVRLLEKFWFDSEEGAP